MLTSRVVIIIIVTLLLSLALPACQSQEAQEYNLKKWQYPPDPKYVVGKRGGGEVLTLNYWITPDEVEQLAFEIAPPGSPDRGGALYRYIHSFGYAWEDIDYWQLPTETIELGVGDCEDKSFLLHSLLLAAGLDSYLVMGSTASLGDERILHCWVECEGYLYEPTVYYENLLVDSEYYRDTYIAELKFKD